MSGRIMIFLIRVMANKDLMTGVNPCYALELSCRGKSFDMGMDPTWWSIMQILSKMEGSTLKQVFW